MAIRPEYAKRIAIHQFKVRRHLGKTLFPYSPGNHESKEKWDTLQTAASDEATSNEFEHEFVAILEAVIDSVSQKADKAKILAGLLPYALALCEAESGGFLVVGDEKLPQNGKANHLIAINRQNLPDEVIRYLMKGPAAQQLLSGRTLWLQSQPYQLNVEQALLGRHKLKYLLGMPLQVGKEVLGAVVIASRTSKPNLSRTELEHRLRTLAQIVALFLENLRLKTRQVQLQGELAQKQVTERANKQDDLEELLAAVMSAEEEVIHQNRDLGMLNAFSHEIAGTLQLNAILEAAVGQTNSLLQAEASWCYMYESGNLVLREQRGLSERYVSAMKFLEPGNGVEGMAFSRKQPIVRDSMLFHTGHVRNLLKEEGLRVVAAVPLVAQGRVFGVLAAAKNPQQAWLARDERMLASIGRQLAQAVANSQQFAEVQTKAQTWEANYSSLQQANAQLAHRAELLERQVQDLRQIEKKIWVMLAASNEARCMVGKTNNIYDDELVAALKRVLAAINDKQEQLLSEV